MKYHVAPDLSPELIKDLKHAAVEQGTTAKELVKRAITGYIEEYGIPKIIKEKE